jgi:hypothetical protein
MITNIIGIVGIILLITGYIFLLFNSIKKIFFIFNTISSLLLTIYAVLQVDIIFIIVNAFVTFVSFKTYIKEKE